MKIKRDKTTLVKKINITIKPEIDIILRKISADTGLKMATIIEKGILLFNKVRNND